MSLSKKLLLGFCLFVPLISARAQYRFDSWTIDNGLPQNSVYSILQTADGYIWLTTLDGLVRFDGVRFTVFDKNNQKNLPSNRFVKLFAEADNTLWICTEESGLVRYRNGEFRAFTTADGLLSNHVSDIQKDTDGSLLVVTNDGIVRFRDNHFSVERERDFRDFKIYVAPSGIRWEMDKSGLLAIGKDGRQTRYDLPFDFQRISSDRTFNYFSHVEMLEDRAGALWFSAASNLYKIKDGATTVLTAKDGMPPSLVRSLAENQQGDIWLGTNNDGACRLAENRFACFNTENGLSSNNVYSIFSDREGTLWISTYERGFNRVTKKIVAPLSTAAGLFDKNVYPILEDRSGAVWLGTFSALSKYENGKITNYTRRDGLLYEIVQSLFEDRDGRLWIGSLGGVEYLENGKFYDFTEKLNLPIGDYNFWDIHQDRGGALWFATNQGLIKYDGATAMRLTTEQGLPDDNVKAILEKIVSSFERITQVQV
jgi:ligand-binding sensor domain-containing protein